MRLEMKKQKRKISEQDLFNFNASKGLTAILDPTMLAYFAN